MDVYVSLGEVSSAEALREEVRRLEDLGVDGVLTGDHIFVSFGRAREHAFRPAEPFALLSAIGAMSDHLLLGTIVANVGFVHPALIIRQYAQLATLYGPERVLAAMGGGWNREEYEALGLTMPSFEDRMTRLEEAAYLARTLFRDGIASFEGEEVTARQLPLSPRPASSPRIMLGGGSDRLLEIAGRYADLLDLNASSRQQALGGAQPIARNEPRRLATTVADLELSVARVRDAAVAAGRPADAVGFSVFVSEVEFCANSKVDETHAAMRARAGLPGAALESCPYVLAGEPELMTDLLAERAQRLSLESIVFRTGPFLDRICRNVVPKLKG